MKVLLPIDGSEGSRKTLDWASRFLDQACTQIHLLHVLFWSVDATVIEQEKELAERLLQTSKKLFENRGFQVVEAVSLLGTPSDVICDYADAQGIDQIIIGSHGNQGLASFLMGSVSQSVFKKAHQPVLLLNNTKTPFLAVSHADQVLFIETETTPRKILLPIDGSAGSQKTLDWATQFLNKDLSEIHLLIAYNVYGFTLSGEARIPGMQETETILYDAKRFLAQHGFQVKEAMALMGSPPMVICDYADAHGIDLIIIGAHGDQGPLQFLMGSTTEKVFQSAHSPVIVLKHGVDQETLKMKQPENIHLAEGEC